MNGLGWFLLGAYASGVVVCFVYWLKEGFDAKWSRHFVSPPWTTRKFVWRLFTSLLACLLSWALILIWLEDS